MRTFGFICFFLLIGFVLTVFSNYIESDFLCKFLNSQLVQIILTLLAINTATTSLLLAKLDEMNKKYGTDFRPTINSLKNAMIAQIILIGFAVIIAILESSQNPNLHFKYDKIVYQTINTAIFLDTVYVLSDVGMLMFDIFKATHKEQK